jgi:hypothetical protein
MHGDLLQCGISAAMCGVSCIVRSHLSNMRTAPMHACAARHSAAATAVLQLSVHAQPPESLAVVCMAAAACAFRASIAHLRATDDTQ